MNRNSLSALFKEQVELAANDKDLSDEERAARALVAIALAVRGLWPDVKETPPGTENQEPPA